MQFIVHSSLPCLYTFFNVLSPPKDSAADGATISWKENFDLAYAELHEIGR